MMTLYTALGTYCMTEGGMPEVISEGCEHALDTHELLLWSILSCQILTYEEISREFYEKEWDLHIMADAELDHYLNRLIARRLVISGRDETGMDALYDLFGHLYLRKTPDDLPTRLAAFLDLWLAKHIPFHKARMVFDRPPLEPLEKKLLKLISEKRLSTAELIQCAVPERFSVQADPDPNERDSKDQISQNQAHTGQKPDAFNIFADSRTMDERRPILAAVANLYLKQKISLQMS